MIDEKDSNNIELDEEEVVEEKKEISAEEEMLFRLQELDVMLEKYEDMDYENMGLETYQEMERLKSEIKDLKSQLKELKKQENKTIWEKLNIGYIIYAALAFLVMVYPLGPLISSHYFKLVINFMNLFKGIEMNETLQSIIVFFLYSLYYLVFIGVDFIIYRFIKKNKINLITMVTIVIVHLLSAIISISFVIGAFF